MSRVVAFVISAKIQWQNFAAIVPSLIERDCSIHFVSLDAYEGPFEKPSYCGDISHFHHTVLDRPRISRILHYAFRRKFLIRFLPLLSLGNAWAKWLDRNNPSLVVFGVDHTRINSYMIHLCNRRRTKTAVLQDAYIPTAYWRSKRWKTVLDFLRYRFDLYIPYAPHPFKAGALSVGLIGDEITRFVQKTLPSNTSAVTVGSPRLHYLADNRGELTSKEHDENIVRIAFIHTNTLPKTEIELQQQRTLAWICETLRQTGMSKGAIVQVVMHSGVYNIDEYRTLGRTYGDFVKLCSSALFSQVVVNSDVCVTYASTGIIDCLYIGRRVGIVTSPEIKRQIDRAVLQFGIEHVNSDHGLRDLVIGARSDRIPLHRISDKVADFAPGWDSIVEATRWITSV